ncbi:lipopolysaccharide biosynthesis protein [Kitasatospora sp. NPDC085464]|uniref:lipopolysaccharide biosynthesis protein n=1 Tax=Kitasatospora sp. NPDC085464 TaxID=3364063 RepID=UPI0037C96532
MSTRAVPAAVPAAVPTRGRAACSCPLPLPCECSYAGLLRARVRALTAGEPLLRNGHVLTASSLLTAAFGAVFWMLATRWYGSEFVGLSYAVLTAVVLISEIGQLDLADVLIRFLPAVGRGARSLLIRCYLIATAAALLVGGLFLVLVPAIAPDLDFLRSPPVAVSFLAMTAGYTLFALQDGALTGLRRPGWVLGENALFAVVKIVLLAVLAGWALRAGILVSWAGALLAALLTANVLLFRRILPARASASDRTAARAADGAAGRDSATAAPRLARYATADYLGALLRLTAATVVPLVVLDTLGPDQIAYYSLAWVIAYTFYLVALNLGSSLIVEAAGAPGRLGEHGRRVLRHAGVLVAAGVLVTVVAAPWVLSLFGAEYAEHGTALLRLLALSALPHLVLSIAVDAARARRRLVPIVALQGVYCVLVLGLTVWLLPPFGLVGVGLAWLIAATVLAVPLLCTLPRWLPAGATTAAETPTTAAPADGVRTTERSTAGRSTAAVPTTTVRTTGLPPTADPTTERRRP